jgi:1-deoxy-D-xylulose-5-phosphate reductoisomerase
VDLNKLSLVPNFGTNSRSDWIAEAPGSQRQILVLGSTGSIGQSTLEVIRRFPNHFSVYALASHGSQPELLAQQIIEFKPRKVAVCDSAAREKILQLLGSQIDLEISLGIDSISDLCREPEVDLIMAAIVGVAGLKPVMAALQAGKKVALANKESLVVAGQLVRKLTNIHGPLIVPVDSEHSALFQALEGHTAEEISSLVLTASGGPFLRKPLSELQKVTVAEAINHPRWKMGAKISVDSATLMNKGLELIEAHYLFGLESNQLKAVVHPQSLIHGIVNMVDGSSMLQASEPDMKEPIAFALNYPNPRLSAISAILDFSSIGSLVFEEIDHNKFPAVNLALDCIRQGPQACLALNEANEQAVSAFLKGNLPFLSIVPFVEEVLGSLPSGQFVDLDSLYQYRDQVIQNCHKAMQKF